MCARMRWSELTWRGTRITSFHEIFITLSSFLELKMSSLSTWICVDFSNLRRNTKISLLWSHALMKVRSMYHWWESFCLKKLLFMIIRSDRPLGWGVSFPFGASLVSIKGSRCWMSNVFRLSFYFLSVALPSFLQPILVLGQGFKI